MLSPLFPPKRSLGPLLPLAGYTVSYIIFSTYALGAAWELLRATNVTVILILKVRVITST